MGGGQELIAGLNRGEIAGERADARPAGTGMDDMGNGGTKLGRFGHVLLVCVLFGPSQASANPAVSRGVPAIVRIADDVEVVRNSPSAYETRRVLVDGSTQHFLSERLEQSDVRGKWIVHFSSGAGEELSAWVVMAPGRVVVTGIANDVPFEFRVERGLDGLLHDVRSFGDARIEAVFNLDDATAPENQESAAAILGFTTEASRESAWRAVDRFNTLLPGLLSGSAGRGATLWPFDGGVAAMVVAVVPESIASYVECLRIACINDGGCWSGSGCHACARDSAGVRFYSALLYLIDLEICLAQHIINPFR